MSTIKSAGTTSTPSAAAGTPSVKRSRRSTLKAAAGASTLVLAALGGVLAVNAPAQASAVGCHIYASGSVAGHVFNGGQYCFGINGSGTWVNFTDGSVNTPAIYNRSEVVRFYDRYGNLYRTVWEPTSYGYTYGFHYWRVGQYFNAKAGGRVCGTLTSSGAGVATVCEGIS